MKKIVLIHFFLAMTTITQANDITLSRGIKSQLRDKIERDINVLDNFKFKSPVEKNILNLMGISNLNAQSATDWLSERVNYVIEENALSVLKLIIKKSIYIERHDVSFPNSNILPYSMDPKNQASLVNEEEESVVVMSNIGAGLYMAGKKENKVYGIKISRGLLKKGIKVPVESPRSGIIQIGEGLFQREITVNNDNSESIANSINRLATFFHEARHSDGNGSSLAFAHSPCPADHDMAGTYACDENLNGPYTIGAVIMKEMLRSCDDTCTEREKEILKIIILDSQNRIMKTTRKGTPSIEWDATPEVI